MDRALVAMLPSTPSARAASPEMDRARLLSVEAIKVSDTMARDRSINSVAFRRSSAEVARDVSRARATWSVERVCCMDDMFWFTPFITFASIALTSDCGRTRSHTYELLFVAGEGVALRSTWMAHESHSATTKFPSFVFIFCAPTQAEKIKATASIAHRPLLRNPNIFFFSGFLRLFLADSLPISLRVTIIIKSDNQVNSGNEAD